MGGSAESGGEDTPGCFTDRAGGFQSSYMEKKDTYLPLAYAVLRSLNCLCHNGTERVEYPSQSAIGSGSSLWMLEARGARKTIEAYEVRDAWFAGFLDP